MYGGLSETKPPFILARFFTITHLSIMGEFCLLNFLPDNSARQIIYLLTECSEADYPIKVLSGLQSRTPHHAELVEAMKNLTWLSSKFRAVFLIILFDYEANAKAVTS